MKINFKYKTPSEIFAIIAVVLIFYTVIALIVAFPCKWAINTWLVYAGKTAMVKYWQAFLISWIPCFGQVIVVGAILTWILMLFLN